MSHPNFYISSDVTQMDLNLVYDFIKNSYWAKDIPYATFEKSLTNSWCFGGFIGEHQQIAFARVITDRATFAYLADIFVTPAYQGQGFSKSLLKHILEEPDLLGLRRLLLCTADAHELYKQFGFRELKHPDQFMAIHNVDVYHPLNP